MASEAALFLLVVEDNDYNDNADNNRKVKATFFHSNDDSKLFSYSFLLAWTDPFMTLLTPGQNFHFVSKEKKKKKGKRINTVTKLTSDQIY